MNQRIDEEYVTRPDNRSEPAPDKLIASEEQRFSRNHDRQPDVCIDGQSRAGAASFHGRSIMSRARIGNVEY